MGRGVEIKSADIPDVVLEAQIVYSDENFNPKPVRRSVGLDGHLIDKMLPYIEKVRLVKLLLRTENMTKKEFIATRSRIYPEDQAYEKRECLDHGLYAHDGFGCLHHSHIDHRHSDQRLIDPVCDK